MTFSEAFAAALQAQGVSVRALARKLADGDTKKMESERRSLQKYLQDDDPTVPTPQKAERIAVELGLAAEHFSTYVVRARQASRLREDLEALETRVGSLEKSVDRLAKQLRSLHRSVTAPESSARSGRGES